LEREVSAQTTIWVELRKQFELAKLDERRDQDSLIILDEATLPMKSSNPRMMVYGFLGLLFGIGSSILTVLVREQLSPLRGENVEHN
jgi:uncharacterized protein involved in exopolysaccharide biosynthesis